MNGTEIDRLTHSPDFNWRRLWLTLLLSVAILCAAAFLVRTFPNSGHQAGYDSAVAKGEAWVEAEVDSAYGSALAACNKLFDESEASPTEPRYEYDSFISGCGEAIDHLYGGHVPLLAPGG